MPAHAYARALGAADFALRTIVQDFERVISWLDAAGDHSGVEMASAMRDHVIRVQADIEVMCPRGKEKL